MTKQPTSANLYPEDVSAFPEVKQKSAILRARLPGFACDDVTLADVFHAGIVAMQAEIAGLWTAADRAMLRAGGPAAVSLLVARGQGFGPGTPRDLKMAKAVELHAAGVADAEIGELFGVSHQWVSRMRQKAAEAAGESGMVAEVARLDGEGVPVREIAKRLGVSWQQVAYWRKSAAGTADKGKLGRARSRSRGAGAVRHVTPGDPAPVSFLAPEVKP